MARAGAEPFAQSRESDHDEHLAVRLPLSRRGDPELEISCDHDCHRPAAPLGNAVGMVDGPARDGVRVDCRQSLLCQPLVGPIAIDLGLSPQAAGLIVAVTQLGYCAGLLLIVPLGDLVENRRLVLAVTTLGALALVGAGLSSHPLPFLLAGLLVGLGSVAVQILIPYAGHLAPAAIRGRVVGNVTSGLMIG